MRTIQRASQVACIGLVLLAFSAVARGQIKHVKEHLNNKEWKDFGESALQAASPSVRNGSNLVKAEYVAMMVNEELIKLGIKPNPGALGRVRALNEDGTCGDLSSKFTQALIGAKVVKDDEIAFLRGAQSILSPPEISKDDTGLVSREEYASVLFKSAQNKKVYGYYAVDPDLANRDHGATVVVIDGKPYVFDLWMWAVEKGGVLGGTDSFSGFAGSKYNGMPIDEWGRDMILKGYMTFNREGGPEGSLRAAKEQLCDISAEVRLPESLVIEEMSQPSGDVRTFRAVIRNPPRSVTYPLSATWTLDGRPVSVMDSGTSTVLTLTGLAAGTHTLTVSITFTNSQTGRVDRLTTRTEFRAATSGLVIIPERPGRVVDWQEVDLAKPDSLLSPGEKNALCGCLTQLITKTKGTRRGFKITPYTFDAGQNACKGEWEYFEFKDQRSWSLSQARDQCRELRTLK